MTKNKWLIHLLYVLGVVALVGYGLCIIGIVASISGSDLPSRSICFRSECFAKFTETVEPVLAVGKAISDLLVAVATVGGILVALLSYFSSVNNSALANHISHFSTFQSYLNSEIGKRGRIHASSIDAFKWYNLAFPYSKYGSMAVSSEYQGFVSDLNVIIDKSNHLASSPAGESFRYKPHQMYIKDQLRHIGIALSLQPRVEYYEIEDQLMSLIGCVNNAFCLDSNIPSLSTRIYL